MRHPGVLNEGGPVVDRGVVGQLGCATTKLGCNKTSTTTLTLPLTQSIRPASQGSPAVGMR